MKKNLLRAIAIALVLTLAVATCFVFAGCTNKSGKGSRDLDGSFEKLDIDFPSGNVYLVDATDNFRIDYEYDITALSFTEDFLNITSDENGTKIAVDFIATLSSKFEFVAYIYLPLSEIKRLDLDMTSGSFDARGLNLDTCNLEVTSGSVALTSSTVSKLDADVTSGNVSVSGNVNSADVELTSGNVNITSDSALHSVDFDTTSGSIVLTMPEFSEGFTLNYKKTSGSLTCDFPLSGNFADDDGSSTYAGGTYIYRVEMTSGTVRINKK